VTACPASIRQFSPEFRDEVVRLAFAASRPIALVARELGVNESLVDRVDRYRAEHTDDEPPLSTSERARLPEVERELRDDA
jgi:transposase